MKVNTLNLQKKLKLKFNDQKILEKSLTKIDYSAIKDISHFLKSSFALMGIRCLNEIIELEKQLSKKYVIFC